MHQDFAPDRESDVTMRVNFAGKLIFALIERTSPMSESIQTSLPTATASTPMVRLGGTFRLPPAKPQSGTIRLGGTCRLLAAKPQG